MSIEFLAAALHADVLPHSRKLVLIGVADHADATGRCWPSIRSLASIAQLDRRNVQKHLAALESKGWLAREARFTEGRQTANVYRVNLEALKGAAVAPREDDASAGGRAAVAPEGGGGDAAGGRRECHGEGGGGTTPGGGGGTTPGGGVSAAPGTVRGTPIRNRQVNPTASESASRYSDAASARDEPADHEQDQQGQEQELEQEEQGQEEEEEEQEHQEQDQQEFALTLTAEEADPVAIRFPARELGHVDIPESKVREWEEAYPGIEVRQELSALKQWSIDNPSRRKKNIIRWCNARLSAKQEHGGSRRPGGGGRPAPRSAEAVREHNHHVAQRWASIESEDQGRG